MEEVLFPPGMICGQLFWKNARITTNLGTSKGFEKNKSNSGPGAGRQKTPPSPGQEVGPIKTGKKIKTSRKKHLYSGPGAE